MGAFLSKLPRFAFEAEKTIDVRNGSPYNPEGGEEGSSSTHHVHRLSMRAVVPITKAIGIGADARQFYRDSNYDSPELEDKHHRNPDARLYLQWDFGL
ncbi:MAG: hypothetical protein NDJ94_07170 [Vicinamibacteria bacterium]|nr:hypothetical protein [Vicinamibacteria bacterium]